MLIEGASGGGESGSLGGDDGGGDRGGGDDGGGRVGGSGPDGDGGGCRGGGGTCGGDGAHMLQALHLHQVQWASANAAPHQPKQPCVVESPSWVEEQTASFAATQPRPKSSSAAMVSPRRGSGPVPVLMITSRVGCVVGWACLHARGIFCSESASCMPVCDTFL